MSSDEPVCEEGGRKRRFQRGETVHVTPGSRHPTYPDLPMGGWSGTIFRIQKKGRARRYWVRFSGATVRQLHSVYAQRELRDFGECELYDNWIPGEMLAAGEAPPDAVEQPDLPPWAQQAGARQVEVLFGLNEGEQFPLISTESLHTWHRFLSEHLSLPRPVFFSEGGDNGQLIRFVEPGSEPVGELDELTEGLYVQVQQGPEVGLVALEQLFFDDADPCATLLDDYRWWYDEMSPRDDDDFGDFGFGTDEQRRAVFKQMWQSAMGSAFKSEFGIDLPLDATLDDALSLVSQSARLEEDKEPDFEAAEPIRAAPRVGRNEPCPCGSGKKYKKCCLRRDSN